MSSTTGDEENRVGHVLDAVFDLFMERGYGGFSMADVAARAGVAETEVTRLGSRPELVLAAVERRVPPIPACPDTGSLRSDLLEIVHWQIDVLELHGPTIERALKAISESAEYAAASRPITQQRMEAYRPLFERAIARGEVDAGFEYGTFVDIAHAQVWARYLAGRPIHHETADVVVDLALQGLIQVVV